MAGRTNNRRYLLWLAVGTATMALAMASLLVFELAQKRAIERSSAIGSDSLTALTFQFEREFLRLRQVLSEAVAKGDASDMGALAMRNDIFQSRLTLLLESPSVAVLKSREEYRKGVLDLRPMVAELDQALGAKFINRRALADVLAEFNRLGADVQALTQAANSEEARLLEQQADVMGQQNRLIVWLTLAQLALLMIASASLVVRQRRQEAERLALEQLTDELREAQFRAEAASRGKSQFLANMSHELRTPFNGLMGMLGLLKGTQITATQGEYIQTAQESAGHLLTLLNDVLDMSALETGKLALKPMAAHLPRLLAEVNALMSPLAKGKGLDFHMRLPDAPLPQVSVDETRLKQILFNLISNAIKFTAAGQVVLTLCQRMLDAHTLEVVFAVRDTGIGIEPQAQLRLFQRFYQVEGSATRRFGGTGLGLEISQSIAQLMHGAITVESVVGKGSTFTATLQLPMVAEAQVPAAAAAPAPPAPPAPTSGATQGMRVLVVEDHPINQKLVGLLLARMDCQIDFCENGQLALERVQQEVFHLILMDVNMPVMDGLTATRLIRALPGTVARTPIVVVTADVMNEARDHALLAGANDFISKPLNVEQLRGIVQRYAAAGMA